MNEWASSRKGRSLSMDGKDAITVKYDPATLTITLFEGGQFAYDVDLEEITDSATALDWIVQLSEKAWVTNEALGAFVRELDKAFDHRFGRSMQGKICGEG